LYELKTREVRIFIAANGRKPYRDWLDSLTAQVRGIIRRRLNRIRFGNFGDTKMLGDGACELRIDFGPGYRVYYGIDGEKIVLLLSGGDKSSQTKDIKQAKIYWNEYKSNKEAHYEREL
jgi:putative addiction module killer protein